jgi:hypothetical protein
MLKQVILSTYLLAIGLASAQVDTSFLRRFRTNYVVPDIPAFKMLGIEPSEILRPCTPKSLAVAASGFFGGQAMILPKSLAVEIAPYTLCGPKHLTQQDYVRNRLFYSSRLSFGTTSGGESDTTVKLGIGLHVTPIDDGDLRNDAEYQEVIQQTTQAILDKRREFETEFKVLNGIDVDSLLSGPALKLQQDYVRKKRDERFGETTLVLRNHYQTRNWNKRRLDIAVGWLQTSPDSLVANARTARLSGWLTYALPVGERGQLLLGGYGTYFAFPWVYADASVAARFYYGVNAIKGFLEGQGRYSGQQQCWGALLNAGTELKLVDEVWLDLGVGAEYPDLRWFGLPPRLVSHFNFKFTTPESFGLF